ncbi:dipeptidyl aminopeptidase/acylaminoacyl peptidase [Xanthomonas sacchari]|uniref:alpha/beta hydrolase family protein n=1 Tax=Xanthomonas sacchari TaxID=56458 RepID=UPI00277F2321|nr:S9 family peptidase [Xanthomonas sacchari]MDQ1091369.1 dipeptidyl aminopeptidase/acylaminoacyl peptidase [Xanthomonas sacchari]
MRQWIVCAGLALACSTGAHAQSPTLDLTPYLQHDRFDRVKISPTGAYYAVTAPLEDRTVLAVVRRSDKEISAKIMGPADSVVDDFWWANDERIVVSMAERYGTRDQPTAIGQLHAVDADGKNSRLLASPYGINENVNGATFKSSLDPSVFMLDTLSSDPRSVLVSVVEQSSDPKIRVEKLDIYNRRRTAVASVPVPRADFVTDHAGHVRFAQGADVANNSKLFYRNDDASPWQLVNDEARSGHRSFPLGFSADDGTAYLQVEQANGPDAVVSWDPHNDRTTTLIRDDKVDPYRILRDLDGKTPIGVSFMSDRVRNVFFDDNAPTARLYRSLENAFNGDAVFVTSATADRRLAMVYVWSDRNNGDYYLYDTTSKHAAHVFSRREWFAPDKMPHSREIGFKARDGMALHGYLTLPLNAEAGKPLPMVLLPHGGPFGIFDGWEFDDDAQLLAAAGYAVLRVNYRGSGNYGRAYTQAGAKEWGGSMQDDLTDATHWAINQGIADSKHICIYGASYGAYAALMGAAKEPELYRCAAGYVGVYDLENMYRDQARRARWARSWAGDWLGERGSLAARSPVNLAAKIRIPVFLAAGGKDERAPVEHTERMEQALKKAGVPVESLYFPNEGHGFYTEPHRRAYYTQLLAFLSRQLGGAQAQ